MIYVLTLGLNLIINKNAEMMRINPTNIENIAPLVLVLWKTIDEFHSDKLSGDFDWNGIVFVTDLLLVEDQLDF